jgi:hypothetical protein
LKLALEFIDRRRGGWRGVLFCFLALLACTLVGLDWIELRSLQDRRSRQIDLLEHEIKSRQADVAKVNADLQLEPRLVEEQKIRQALNYPWNRMLGEVERVQVDNVAILSLLHDQAEQRTHLTVEARDTAALNSFVAKMNSDSETTNWYVSNFRLQTQGPQGTVQAEIAERSESQ